MCFPASPVGREVGREKAELNYSFYVAKSTKTVLNNTGGIGSVSYQKRRKKRRRRGGGGGIRNIQEK